MGKGEHSGDWKHGLCDCFNSVDNCLCGTFCAPYQLYTNAEKLGDNGLLHYLLYFYNPCLPIYLQRRNLRQRKGYPGSACEDGLVAYGSPCCASIQIANELDQLQTTRNDQAPIVTTQVTINNPAPVQVPTVQAPRPKAPYCPDPRDTYVQVPVAQACNNCGLTFDNTSPNCPASPGSRCTSSII